MNQISTFVFAFATLAATLSAQDESNYHAIPTIYLGPWNNISSDAITTSLKDTDDESSSSNVTPNNATGYATQTSPRIVPEGTKTYVAGLRTTAEGNNFCSATLISPTHLLTGTYCIPNGIRWASIGSHYVNGTQDGEQIKVVAILSHPKSSNANFSDEFAVLVLQKPSKFKPAVLAASDDSDVKDGEWAVKLGWDDTGGKGTMAYELTRADVQLMSNANCLNETMVDDSMMCTRGLTNTESCTGDYGGPLVVEKPNGDVVVGVVSWGPNCFMIGYPSIYSRVSSARSWIESVAGGVCFH